MTGSAIVRMTPETLITARHSLWLQRISEYNRRSNDGEEMEGFSRLDDLAQEGVAVVLELEHVADALGIRLDRRLYG